MANTPTPDVDPSQPTRLSLNELSNEGYLLEVNRRLLHPLGLALTIEDDELYVQDGRDDPEGWCFDSMNSFRRAKVQRVRELEDARRPARVAALGYFVQPSAKVNPEPARPSGPVAPGPRWTPVDSRHVLPATDQALRTRLGEVLEELDRLQLQFGPKVRMMRDAMAGQPQAARTTHDGREWPWCWIHEQTIDRCDEAGEVCDGEITGGPSDPTGNAGVVRDRAAQDHKDLTRLLELVVRAGNQALDIAVRYPTTQVEPVDIDPGPGELYCRCCYKDNQRLELITRRDNGNGRPYYPGLCIWCGRRRAALGLNMDPPTWMVQMRHRSQPINETHMARARQELERVAELKAADTKSKKKSKKKGR
ncbi:MAG: hypothetical protein JWM89_1817 [Acidimicrobiales bacterium]|nr:hypothetical protein [Acidimicrobiales bacterium]